MALTVAELGRFWKRYAIVIIFPLIASSSIYADYSYTLKCKAKNSLQSLPAPIEKEYFLEEA